MNALIPCPACGGITSLAPALQDDARLRCPHCQAEFSAVELRHSTFPTWQVLEEGSDTGRTVHHLSTETDLSSETADLSGKSDVTTESDGLIEKSGASHTIAVDGNDVADTTAAADLIYDHDFGFSAAAEQSRLPSVDAKPSGEVLPKPTSSFKDDARLSQLHAALQPAKPKMDWSGFHPLLPQQYERMKERNRRSPVWPVLQVALGGLAAIPISLLLIWHLIGSDIADAGPFVGRFLPWIVPQDFRPRDNLPQNDPSVPAADASDQSRAQSDASDEQPSISAAFTNQTVETQAGSSPAGDESKEIPSYLRESAASANSKPAVVASERAGVEEYAFSLVSQTQVHLRACSLAFSTSSSDLPKLAQVFYRDLSLLAEMIDSLPSDSSRLNTLREEMEPISQTVAERDDLRNLVSQGSWYWLRKQAVDSTPVGLALMVEVSKVKPRSDAWQVIAAGGSGLDAEVALLLPRNLAAEPQAGQSLFLTGMVIKLEKSDLAAPDRWIFTANYVAEF